MSSFTIRIESSQGYLSFYFNAIPSSNNQSFFVSVIDRDNKAITFGMHQQSAEEWIISDRIKTPHWIVSIEDSLSRQIFNNTRQKIQKRKSTFASIF